MPHLNGGDGLKRYTCVFQSKEMAMKTKMVVFTAAAALMLILNLGGASQTAKQEPIDGPQYTSDNRLVRPVNYRNWIYLSSSLGLQYGPDANPADPAFENVYVNPSAYSEFMKSGKWPDKTIFVLEIRRSMDKGTFAQGGRYQGDLVTMEAAVKDESRFPEKWAYFGLGRNAESARAIPKTGSCFTCHSANAAVENSFAQFYPTVFAVAKEKGTLNPGYLKAEERREVSESHSSAEEQSGAAAPKATNPPEEEVDDLVCNMQVSKKTAFKTDYKGKTYYFCRQECKSDFERAPEQFIKTGKN
jgi:YHS domain-containing protein